MTHVKAESLRFDHFLVVFSQHSPITSCPSLQIGSYFGSVLQTIDVNNDSFTDLLLVGAPMYMGSDRDEQGQVYVYKLSQVCHTEI